ncbi:hypothetical protein C7212DRAFT_153264 [Tuber magnatum]|uniref:DUF7492 domain-containing protein n=1 Tax=Tuber magnatum TaxID=42249 RepID=A0A317SZ11_9PEZI|nr:hypothetical protein C7212DRAFT_153264 [Tuber magnatum]
MHVPTRSFFQLAGVAVIALISGVHGHSWIDGLTVVKDTNANPLKNTTTNKGGPQNAVLGYIRAYKGHVDATSVYRVEAPKLDVNICRESQRNPTENPGQFPPLSASPGDSIQGTYLENGHISKPDAADGTPGTIYWFGTANPKPEDTLANVKQWTTDGKGGDGRGRLLEKPSDFDDGGCAEKDNGTPISKQRKAAGGGGACKSVFKLPEDAKVGSKFTVYWVWDYSNHFGPTKKGHTEWYTSCMDIQVVAPKGKRFWNGSAKFRGRL